MLSNVNMWKSARNCSEKQNQMETLWKVNGFFCDAASSPSLHPHSCLSYLDALSREEGKKRRREEEEEG